MCSDVPNAVPGEIAEEMARCARARTGLQRYLTLHQNEIFGCDAAKGKEYVVLTIERNGVQRLRTDFFSEKERMREFAADQDVFACGWRHAHNLILMF